ncbi:hypothetical protein B4U80_02599 [Leptotrombidium deliense]|uniref:Uncharacterized protein n=1 Tax=Leptotrombidium deliense TaxID=299467 RepID=A0A443SWB8_9ACAR|nr:hypothetical protein B4U80_02599 [Leptotrombidium deliense]
MCTMFTAIIYSTILSQIVFAANSGVPKVPNATMRTEASGLHSDRQFPDSSVLLPNMLISTIFPIAVIIGIGVVLLKVLIFGLWIFGRSSMGGYGGYGGYGGLGGLGGLGGYGQYGSGAGYSTANIGWRVDPASGRSMHDNSGFPVSSLITPKIMSLINTVSDALDKHSKKQN